MDMLFLSFGVLSGVATVFLYNKYKERLENKWKILYVENIPSLSSKAHPCRIVHNNDIFEGAMIFSLLNIKKIGMSLITYIILGDDIETGPITEGTLTLKVKNGIFSKDVTLFEKVMNKPITIQNGLTPITNRDNERLINFISNSDNEIIVEIESSDKQTKAYCTLDNRGFREGQLKLYNLYKEHGVV